DRALRRGAQRRRPQRTTADAGRARQRARVADFDGLLKSIPTANGPGLHRSPGLVISGTPTGNGLDTGGWPIVSGPFGRAQGRSESPPEPSRPPPSGATPTARTSPRRPVQGHATGRDAAPWPAPAVRPRRGPHRTPRGARGRAAG